jgi:hypothetical protein
MVRPRAESLERGPERGARQIGNESSDGSMVAALVPTGKRPGAAQARPDRGVRRAAPGRTVAQDVDEIAARIGIDAASLLGVVEAYRTCS